jgi:hypothetical protein
VDRRDPDPPFLGELQGEIGLLGGPVSRDHELDLAETRLGKDVEGVLEFECPEWPG